MTQDNWNKGRDRDCTPSHVPLIYVFFVSFLFFLYFIACGKLCGLFNRWLSVT